MVLRIADFMPFFQEEYKGKIKDHFVAVLKTRSGTIEAAGKIKIREGQPHLLVHIASKIRGNRKKIYRSYGPGTKVKRVLLYN